MALVRELAEGRGNRPGAAKRLGEVEKELERARLAAETTLSRENSSERRTARRPNLGPLLRGSCDVATMAT